MEEGRREGGNIPEDKGQDDEREEGLKNHHETRNPLVEAQDGDIPHVGIVPDAFPEYD